MIPRVLLLMFPATTLFLGLPGITTAQEYEIAKPISQLVGEDYRYSIDFLFFKGLAEGELRLKATEQANVFRAELIGRTLGIASWIAGDRTQTYTSLVELTPEGSLRSIEHIAQVVKRKWGRWQRRERIHRYDYKQGKVFVEKSREGMFHSSKVSDIPGEQEPVDLLAAFYNLRAGVYGPFTRGSQFLIPTYSGKGFVDIEVDILTLEEQAEQGAFPSHGLLMSVKIDPKILDTYSGQLYCWFNNAGVPERGIVEDVIGMGDVRGTLDLEEL